MDNQHDNRKPNSTSVTLTIHFEYEKPEPENGIHGGYVVTDWCDEFENLSTNAKQIVSDELQEKLNSKIG